MFQALGGGSDLANVLAKRTNMALVLRPAHPHALSGAFPTVDASLALSQALPEIGG